MRRGLGALTALVVLAACGEQIDSPTMLEPPSTSATASAADRYVVVMNRAPDGSTVAVNNITGRLGITADHVYDRAISGFAADLTDAQVADLEADPQVAFVERDQIFRTTGNQSPTPSWGLDRIDQDVPGGDPRLDNSYTYPNSAGSGVEVYMFDTGINMTHTDFAGRLGTGFSAVPGVPNPVDDHGHGSHTAGTVAGATYGVAKSANPIYPVKICNAAGSCFTSWTIAGINWAIGNASLPAVGNMSIGGGFSASLNAAVANAVTAGHLHGRLRGEQQRQCVRPVAGQRADRTHVGRDGHHRHPGQLLELRHLRRRLRSGSEHHVRVDRQLHRDRNDQRDLDVLASPGRDRRAPPGDQPG